jgi:hypothetical protein
VQTSEEREIHSGFGEFKEYFKYTSRYLKISPTFELGRVVI